ncbi:MAG: hypothetical protein JXB30_02555 [Anaerolineae bacterium]|nr:hypothetical protein [Anaerolineae bacterium]
MGNPNQFFEDFGKEPQAIERWTWFTGDGSAGMEFVPGDGYASIHVDATRDRRNIWWALIKREVSPYLDLARLHEPGQELRIEACIRVSHAPRRVNLHIYNAKRPEHHAHLMEFDIPDTTGRHIISMTTQDFDAEPGDSVYGQLALMDWGIGAYRVDIAYMKMEVVDAATAGPDQGVQVPYHPPIPDPGTFEHQITVAHDCLIDVTYPDVNFNNWCVQETGGKTTLLTISGMQIVILRWDLAAWAGRRVAGSGLLALTTHSVQRSSDELYEFGKMRVVEILGGDPQWDQTTVTYNSLCQGRPIDAVLNPQMIIDVDVAAEPGGKTPITISRPVLQRMLDGKTLGLALRPLGAINASFYAMENEGKERSARLLFNLQG